MATASHEITQSYALTLSDIYPAPKLFDHVLRFQYLPVLAFTGRD
jgi:hypothetical protein